MGILDHLFLYTSYLSYLFSAGAYRRPQDESCLYSPIPTIHFSVRVAHLSYDECMEDEGYWTTISSLWSVDEPNRHITYDALLASILHHACDVTKRANLKKWVRCGDGDWNLGHTNPANGRPRDVACWEESRLLSAVIDSGPYEQRGSGRHGTKARHCCA